MHGFWWHFWHDPIRDNPWSFAGLALMLAGAVAYALTPSWRRK